MVITTGVLACLGHGLIFVYNLPWLALHIDMCSYSFTSFVYNLSFGANFFIYYFFNKSFRRVLLLNICRLHTLGCVRREANRSSGQTLRDSSSLELRPLRK
jgi:hypothetical protein